MLWLLANWRLGLAGLAVIAGLSLLAWERHQGAESVRKADAVKVAAAQVHAASVTGQLAGSASAAGSEARVAHQRLADRTAAIRKRIPDEIPHAADVRLGPGFLRLYNASLGLPESAGPAEGASDQPGLYSAEALAVIAPNNAECLKGWDAYRRVVTLYDQVQGSVNGFRR